MSQLTDTQLAILRFVELADGEGSTLAHDIAQELRLKSRGMANRLVELERRGLLSRVIARPRASWRSDALYGWCLTARGREAVAGPSASRKGEKATDPLSTQTVRSVRTDDHAGT